MTKEEKIELISKMSGIELARFFIEHPMWTKEQRDSVMRIWKQTRHKENIDWEREIRNNFEIDEIAKSN